MALKKTGVQFIHKDLDAFLRGMGQATDAVSAFGRAAADAGDKAKHGLGRADSALGALGRSATTTGDRVSAASHIMIGAFREIGAMATRALYDAGRAAGRLAFDFGKQALGGAMDLQDSMNLLGATSDATTADLARLKKMAVDLGADLTLPATSAADAGAAMLELSKAGLTVEQVMGAAKGTLQLAAAANISEAEAAEIAANALNSFKLKGDRAVFVADLLAGAANKSSIEITDAAASFKMASAVFSAFQGPAVGAEQAMVDLTTAIAILGNAGIKGSDAGTSLKQMLLQLTGPTKKAKGLMEDLAASLGVSGDIAFTAAGKMRPMEEIISLVTRATAKMTEEQRAATITQIFGADASRAVIALMQAGPAAFDEMTKSITEQGSAAKLAAARTSGLRGAWDGLKSQIETAGIILAEPFLEPLSLGLSALSDTIAEFPLVDWAKKAEHALGRLVRLIQGPMMPKERRRVGGEIDEDFVPAGEESWRGIGQEAMVLLKGYRDRVIAFIRSSAPVVLNAFQSWARGLVRWIDDGIPVAIEKLGEYRDRLVSFIITNVARQLGMSLEQTLDPSWITKSIPGALAALLDYRNQVTTFILSNAPTVLDTLGKWGEGLGNWVTENAPVMIQTFGEKTAEFIGVIGTYTPPILDKLREWGGALGQWIVEAAPGMLRELGRAAGKILVAIGEALPGIVESLSKWGERFIQWVPEAAPKLMTELLKLAEELGSWILRQAPGILMKLGEWTASFQSWVVFSAVPGLLKALINVDIAIFKWIKDKAMAIAADGSVGRAIVDGIWKGISGAWAWLMEKMGNLAKQLPEGIKKVLNIKSPSLVAALQIGEPFAAGIGAGFEREIMRVQKTMALSMAQLATPQAIMPAQRGDMFIPQQAQIAQGMGGANVSIQINNPVVDSNERVSQLGAQLRRSVFAALKNGVAELKLTGSSTS